MAAHCSPSGRMVHAPSEAAGRPNWGPETRRRRSKLRHRMQKERLRLLRPRHVPWPFEALRPGRVGILLLDLLREELGNDILHPLLQCFQIDRRILFCRRHVWLCQALDRSVQAFGFRQPVFALLLLFLNSTHLRRKLLRLLAKGLQGCPR